MVSKYQTTVTNNDTNTNTNDITSTELLCHVHNDSLNKNGTRHLLIDCEEVTKIVSIEGARTHFQGPICKYFLSPLHCMMTINIPLLLKVGFLLSLRGVQWIDVVT